MITLPKLKKRISATLSIRSFAIGIGVGILLVVVAAAAYLNRGGLTSRADEDPQTNDYEYCSNEKPPVGTGTEPFEQKRCRFELSFDYDGDGEFGTEEDIIQLLQDITDIDNQTQEEIADYIRELFNNDDERIAEFEDLAQQLRDCLEEINISNSDVAGEDIDWSQYFDDEGNVIGTLQRCGEILDQISDLIN